MTEYFDWTRMGGRSERQSKLCDDNTPATGGKKKKNEAVSPIPQLRKNPDKWVPTASYIK